MSAPISYRTDRNNNPSAFTTDIARQAGLEYGTDFINGDPFPAPSNLITAKLLGDPVELTVKVIDAIGYFTKSGTPRWTYIALPRFIWDGLTAYQKRDVIGFHYEHEGGVALRGLFPNYGQS